MNIDEYRAMVAEEAKEAEQTAGQTTVTVEGADEQSVQTVENPITSSEQTIQTPEQTSTTPEQTPVEAETPSIPSTVEVDGKQVPLEELTQGYLRQSDYTRKTQELARIKQQVDVAQKYYDAINSDPEFAEGIARRFDLPYLTPEQTKMQELEQNYHTLLIERDIEKLQSKYDDFDAEAVVRTAFEKRLDSLEEAYLFNKAINQPVVTQPAIPDINSLKEQIRQELLSELQSNVDTSTIIGTGGSTAQVQSTTPELSTQEMRVARNMGMTPKEYAKWKNK